MSYKDLEDLSYTFVFKKFRLFPRHFENRSTSADKLPVLQYQNAYLSRDNPRNYPLSAIYRGMELVETRLCDGCCE